MHMIMYVQLHKLAKSQNILSIICGGDLIVALYCTVAL